MHLNYVVICENKFINLYMSISYLQVKIIITCIRQYLNLKKYYDKNAHNINYIIILSCFRRSLYLTQ